MRHNNADGKRPFDAGPSRLKLLVVEIEVGAGRRIPSDPLVREHTPQPPFDSRGIPNPPCEPLHQLRGRMLACDMLGLYPLVQDDLALRAVSHYQDTRHDLPFPCSCPDAILHGPTLDDGPIRARFHNPRKKR